MVAVYFKRIAVLTLAVLATVACDKSKGSRNSVGYSYSNAYTNNARAAYENCDARLWPTQQQAQCDNVQTGNICSISQVYYNACPQVRFNANPNDPNVFNNLKSVYFNYLNSQDPNAVNYMTQRWNQLAAQYGGGFTGQQPYYPPNINPMTGMPY